MARKEDVKIGRYKSAREIAFHDISNYIRDEYGSKYGGGTCHEVWVVTPGHMIQHTPAWMNRKLYAAFKQRKS